MLSYYRRSLACLLMCLLSHPCYANDTPIYLEKMPHDHYSHLTLAGDVFSAALPIIGIASAFQDDNLSTLVMPALSVATVSYANSTLKRTFKNTALGMRPNGYHSSFPSAHSSYAFIGAKLIHKHWGHHYGAAAYGLAIATAVSRVEGHYHYPRDVIVGALLSFAVDAAFSQISVKLPHVSGLKLKGNLSKISLEYRF